MKKRYQVFVSSTYEDLKVERQAAVEAILKAGHIPAGMELFTAGDQSQMEVIRRWIDESDIYMLILGARYGSIEPSSGLSYTELEFNYANQIGKPFFSVVLTDEGREAKVKAHGAAVLETRNPDSYLKFRDNVMGKLCAFFATPQDVKLAVFETLPHLIAQKTLVGWVSATDAQPSGQVSNELARLSQHNAKLLEENERLRKQITDLTTAGPSFDDLYKTLLLENVHVPPSVNGGKSITVSLLQLSLRFSSYLARGVSSAALASELERFVFYEVASRLATYGLVEEGKTPTKAMWQRLRLSKEGVKFISRASVLLARNGRTGGETTTEAASERNEGSDKTLPSATHKAVRPASKKPL